MLLPGHNKISIGSALKMCLSSIGIFLCILGVAWSQDSFCDDIDSDVCRTFNLHVNVCADKCLSKLCPRTCDKCPRKCYSCSDVSSLNDCNTTHICPDRTYNCLVHEGIASDFSITYQLGCATNLVCDSLFGDGNVLGRRKRSGINGECCNTDLCNKHDPTKRRRLVVSMLSTMNISTEYLTDSTTESTTGSATPITKETTSQAKQSTTATKIGSITPITMEIRPKSTKTTTRTSIIPSTNTTRSTTVLPVTATTGKPVCADIDTASCQKLATLRRDMCNDDCIVQACPRTCGKCPECYTCFFVDAPENCTDTSVCLPGEKCYVVKEYMDSGEYGYRAGCLHENVCTRFHANAGSVFGRRSDHLDLILDGDCCNGDLCNHHALVHTTSTTSTTTTTHAPTQAQSTTVPPDGCMYLPRHHCPTGFSVVGGKCLWIGTRALTYESAKISCKYHCSNLMENISDRDIESIRILMDSLFWGLPNDKKVVIVGAHTDSHNHLVWDTSGRRVSDVPHDLHGNGCLVIEHGGPHGHSLKPSACDRLHYYICEAKFK